MSRRDELVKRIASNKDWLSKNWHHGKDVRRGCQANIEADERELAKLDVQAGDVMPKEESVLRPITASGDVDEKFVAAIDEAHQTVLERGVSTTARTEGELMINRDESPLIAAPGHLVCRLISNPTVLGITHASDDRVGDEWPGRPDSWPHWGVVTHFGPCVPPAWYSEDVAIGQTVMIRHHAGVPLAVRGVDYIVLRYEDVQAVLRKPHSEVPS